MKTTLILIAATLALAGTADAKGKGRKNAPAPVETTTTTTTTTTVPWCGAHCVPSEWTLVEGTECDYKRAECATGKYGEPACWFYGASCE